MTEQSPKKDPLPIGDVSARQKLTNDLITRAEHDLIYEPRIMGESLYMLQRYFQDFIRDELERRSITFDDHPLMLPFLETHARELCDFVMMGVGLNHHIRLPDLERLGPDPERLRRVDLWDSLSAHIAIAEDHFLSGIGGLQQILTRVEEAKSLRRDTPRPSGSTDSDD